MVTESQLPGSGNPNDTRAPYSESLKEASIVIVEDCVAKTFILSSVPCNLPDVRQASYTQIDMQGLMKAKVVP